jgi:hypothetical protein
LAQGVSPLFFDGDYKSFFDNDDPQLIARESLEREYTKRSLIFQQRHQGSQPTI